MVYIQVLPEFGLVVDPLVGIITTAGVSYTPVLEQVAELEKITDDLVDMLSGEGSFLSSFPNREGVLNIAGGVNAFWYGMAVGLLVAGVVVLGLL